MTGTKRVASSRTLTVFSTSGLANRLRVLVSGLALAEATGRAFRMVWPRTPNCAAAFRELFVGDWPVTDVDRLEPGWLAHRLPPGRPPGPLALSDQQPDVVLGSSRWLVDVRQHSTQPVQTARCVALLARLEPLPELRDRITEFRARHFRAVMIGLHLRRGDFLRYRPDLAGNTGEALAAVDRYLTVASEAGVFLCTDDGALDPGTGGLSREGIHELVRARYGERVVSATPRSLDRRTVQGIQDALVDLWLLRTTHMVVGTMGSSFSGLGVFGRGVPHVMVGHSTRGYHRVERLARLTGVHWLVRRLFRAAYGYDLPFLPAWKRLVEPARRRARMQVRQCLKACARWAARPRRWLAGIGLPRSG